MDKFFAVFGKIILILFLVGAVTYGAYYFGKTSTPATTMVPSKEKGLEPEKVPSVTPPPTTKPIKVVSAGLGASSGLSFTKYQMTVPQDWTASHETTNEGTWTDTLTLTKGSSQLKLFQGATGGALCLYPGDADFEGPSAHFDNFVEITTADSIVLRRGWTTATTGTTKGFTMCQKGPENFGQPTVFGHMSLTTSLNPDAALLSEVDAMIASLKKL